MPKLTVALAGSSSHFPTLRVWKYLAFILCVVLSFAIDGAALAADKLAVPVYFVTDRQLNSASVNDLDYSSLQMPEGQLNYGVKNIVLVGKDFGSNVSERASGLGWWCPNPQDGDSSPPQRSTTLSEEELFSNLNQTLTDGTKDRPLILFLHGCCQPFKSSVETAARLAHDIEAPVLLYSWSSIPPTEQKYRENEIRQRNGNGTFYQFLDRLERKLPPERTIVVAHSMGNRFVHEALKTRYWNRGSNLNIPKFRNVIFACADVNVDDFVSDEKGVSFSCNRLSITKNDTDPALGLSQIQRGLYGRLGAPRWSVRKLLSVPTADVYDISRPYRNSHDLPIPILKDIVRADDSGYSPRYRFFQQKPHLFNVEN